MHPTAPLLISRYVYNNRIPKNGRRSVRFPFPYNGVRPLVLNDTVSGRSNKQQNVSCLQEMSVLFACMKGNDFVESVCQQELEAFQRCHQQFMHTQQLKNEQDRRGILVPGAKTLSHKQLNILLKKHPQPK